MKILPYISLALAMLSQGISGTAQAGVYAYSNLNILNLQAYDPDQVLATDQLDLVTEINVASLAVPTSSNATLNNPLKDVTKTDGTSACVGDVGACAAIGEDAFALVAVGTQHYAYSDTRSTGSQVSDSTNSLGFGAIAQNTTALTVEVVSQTMLLRNDIGSGDADANSSTTFIFAGTGSRIGFRFASSGYLEAFQQAGNNTPPSVGFASASFSIVINELNAFGSVIGQVFNWRPDGFLADNASTHEVFDTVDLNLAGGVSANTSPSINTHSFAGGVFEAESKSVLSLGTTYQIGFTHETSADATKDVPEPSILALFGIALLGLIGRYSNRVE